MILQIYFVFLLLKIFHKNTKTLEMHYWHRKLWEMVKWEQKIAMQYTLLTKFKIG